MKCIRRLCKVSTEWSSGLAYAVGIIATDGNLSPDSRHVNITSKDKQILLNCKKCLGLENKIGRKSRAGFSEKKYYVLQFGDKNFYEFLNHIGLTAAKSKTIGCVNVPSTYFKDFLRGCIDGDGSISVAVHPQSRRPQLRIRICSASITFLQFLKKEILKMAAVKGGWIYTSPKKIYTLSFGKTDSIIILNLLYYSSVKYYLVRKYKIAKKFLNGRVA
ncbi:MAG: LAGLIDADG family homing endonuclease [bacterium]|nr:LAGLIDADG family homing endonuclease [bacterium]